MKQLIAALLCMALSASCASEPAKGSSQAVAAVATAETTCAVLHNPMVQTLAPRCLSQEEVEAFRLGKIRGSFVVNSTVDASGKTISEFIYPPKK